MIHQRTWLYSSGCSEELWTWTFIHISWTYQYVSEGFLFWRLLENLIHGPSLKRLGTGLGQKTIREVFFLWLVKSLKNLQIKDLLSTLRNLAIFYFLYGFRCSQLTVDLLTVVSDRIASAFDRSGATQAVVLDISKAFDKVWHADLLHKLKC